MTDIAVDVRNLPHGRRHEQIFASARALKDGEGGVIINDHHPKPLHGRLKAMYGADLKWTYLERGPQPWRVQIGEVSA